MTAEHPNPPPEELSDEQQEVASFFIESCGLQDVADEQVEMRGQTGSVAYGLVRCAEHIMDMTPEEIREMVLTKLEQQAEGSSERPTI